MPYIYKKHRERLDPLVDALGQEIKKIKEEFPEQTRDGSLNYSVTRLLNMVFADARYHDLNELIGFLECCKLEYYRKVAAPYEDLKEKDNGPVDTFNKGDNKGY